MIELQARGESSRWRARRKVGGKLYQGPWRREKGAAETDEAHLFQASPTDISSVAASLQADTSRPVAQQGQIDSVCVADLAHVLETPDKKPKIGEHTASLSPSTVRQMRSERARRLAQSCRKSPAPTISPFSGLRSLCVSPPPVAHESFDAGLEQIKLIVAAEQNQLLPEVREVVRKLYWQVHQSGPVTDSLDYLPKPRDRQAYEQLRYVRTLHAGGKLTVSEYRVLAHIPQVLGPEVYGEVELSEGSYRWTFAAAGISVDSPGFATRQQALQELRLIQMMLYPIWMDIGRRDAHMQHILRTWAQDRDLRALANHTSLRFAKARLHNHRPIVSAMACPDSLQPRHSNLRGFPNLGNTCYINAITACLFHCDPFRADLLAQVLGMIIFGDCMRKRKPERERERKIERERERERERESERSECLAKCSASTHMCHESLPCLLAVYCRCLEQSFPDIFS